MRRTPASSEYVAPSTAARYTKPGWLSNQGRGTRRHPHAKLFTNKIHYIQLLALLSQQTILWMNNLGDFVTIWVISEPQTQSPKALTLNPKYTWHIDNALNPYWYRRFVWQKPVIFLFAAKSRNSTTQKFQKPFWIPEPIYILALCEGNSPHKYIACPCSLPTFLIAPSANFTA